MSYMCNCPKVHDIHDYYVDQMIKGKEFRLQCCECDLDIIVGCQQVTENEYYSYSFSAKDMLDMDRLSKIKIIRSMGEPILMKCGHFADLKAGMNPVCSKCAYDEVGYRNDNKDAWEIVYN